MRALLVLAVLSAVLLAGSASVSARPDPATSRADECLRKPVARSKMGPLARRHCGGAYPIVLSIIGNYWTCDWGPGSSPRYTTRHGGC